MSLKKSRLVKGVILPPDAYALEGIDGEIKVDIADGKLKATLGATSREILTNSQTQTITAKTINAPDNTITNIEDANISPTAAIALSKLATGALPVGITVTSANISDLSIVDADISASAAIDPSKIGAGALPSGITVNSTNIVDDSIVDADINSAAAIARTKLASGTANRVVINNSSGVQSDAAAITAARALISDANGIPTQSAVTSTELGHVSGVTSAIQTQLNSKQATITGAATTITSADLTASRAVVSDGAGKVAVSAVTSVELGHVSGVTSAIQTQLDTKVTGPASATDEAVVRYDATTGKLVQNSVVTITDTGVAAGLTGLSSSGVLNSTGSLLVNGTFSESRSINSVATGSNATIINPNVPVIRLTNASLVSVDMISLPSSGLQVTVTNATGSDITINNNLGATLANRILTGTKSNIVLKDEASIILKYNTDESRWFVIGGVGSGGSGGINYITNSDAESGDTGYVTYLDAAGTAPVDGIGVGANVTIAASAVAPLRGTKSFLITKDAGFTRQGQGVSYPFTIDVADQAQILRVSFDYESSVNYKDDDMRVYIYDVTNSQLIEVVNNTISASTQGKYIGSFQTSSNSTSYRLIFHVASSVTTLVYTLKMDNIVVGPQTLTKGAIVTDMKPSTGTLTDNTNVTATFYEGRRGDTLVYEGRLVWTGAGAGLTLRITLPAGYVIDFSKTNAAGSTMCLGSASWYDVSTPISHWLNPYAANANQISFLDSSSNNAVWDYSQAAAGDAVTFKIEVPIVGWSSNTVMSEDSGNREIAAKASRITSGQLVTAAGVVLVFNNKVFDTSDSYNSATGIYTASESGYYDVGYSLEVVSQAATSSLQFIGYVNGLTAKYYCRWVFSALSGAKTYSPTANDVVYLSKGDTFEVRGYSAGADSTLASNAADRTYLTIAKRSSPQTIMGSEVVAAQGNCSIGQTITNGAIIVYNNATQTHGTYDTGTGIFTAPSSGYYNFQAWITTVSVAVTVGNYIGVRLLSSGSSYYGVRDFSTNASARVYNASISTTVYLAKGDTGAFYFDSVLGVTNLSGVGARNIFSITKVG
jgi:hypothetical protein